MPFKPQKFDPQKAFWADPVKRIDASTMRQMLDDADKKGVPREQIIQWAINRWYTIEKPDKSWFIQNVGEWLASFAGNIPKVVAETWILDKPIKKWAVFLADKIRRGVGKAPLTPAQIWQAPEFSEVAAGSQVGWDPESKVARTTELVADVTSVAWWLSPVIKKWASKIGKVVAKRQAAKKQTNVLWNLLEKPNVKNIRKAIMDWRLKPEVKSLLKWTKAAEITPSDNIVRASEVVAKEIDKPWKTATELYWQMWDLIESKAKTLQSELKTMKIWTMTKKRKQFVDALDEAMEVGDQLTRSDMKKIDLLKTKVKNAKTADQIRDARKQRDELFSEAVKNPTSTSAPSTLRMNKVWLAWRNTANDMLDDISKMFGKDWTREMFKDMSSMYEAQQVILDKAADFGKSAPWIIGIVWKRIKEAAIGAWLVWWWSVLFGKWR